MKNNNITNGLSTMHPTAVSCDRDYSISAVRAIAFIFIVLCHFLQFFENNLAWWFNVGVQIFLFISGYLYGVKYANKQINTSGFLKNRFIKILVPYYLVIVPAIIIHLAFIGDISSKLSIVRIIICNTTLSGGEHLWFVPTILMCYLLTPMVINIITSCTKRNVIIVSLVLLISLFIFFHSFISQFYYSPAWIICYYFGLLYGINSSKPFIKPLVINLVFFVLSLQNILQIINDNYVHLFDTSNDYYKIWCDFNHVWLGICIFIAIRWTFNRFNVSSDKPIIYLLKLFDYFSYEGYLIHHFLILGPLSMMTITHFGLLNVLITLVAIAILTVLIKSIETFIFRCWSF